MRKSPLAPETASRVREIAVAVAGRMQDLATLEAALKAGAEQSKFPNLMQWQPDGVAYGGAGLAILFSYLDACEPDAGWDLAGKWHLERVAEAIQSHDGDFSMALFGGLSGCAFTCWMLSREGTRYRGMLGAIEGALCPIVTSGAKLLLDRVSGGYAYHEFDVISGLSGAAAYCLCRPESRIVRESLVAILECLVAMSHDHGGVPKWHTPAVMLPDGEMAERYPSGNLNCGLAHGIPGPLAAMSLAAIRGVEVDGLHEAIERLAAWLLTHRADDRWGMNWPTAIPLNGYADWPTSDSERWPNRCAWCYGIAGISRALFLAGQAAGRREYGEKAVAAMTAIFDRPIAARFIDSPTFCHGVAGLLQTTLRFASDTGLLVFNQQVNNLANQLIDAYEPGSILGYRSLEADGRRVDNAGLLDGAAGVALALLAAASEVEPSWDRLFLLS